MFRDVEANDRNFNLFFDSDYGTKVYSLKEPCPIPWTNKDYEVEENTRLIVLPKIYDFAHLKLNYQQCAVSLKKSSSKHQDGIKTFLFLLVPKDVEFGDTQELEKIRTELKNIGIDLMIYPQLTEDFEEEMYKKIRQIVFLRHDFSALSTPQKTTSFSFKGNKITFVAIDPDTNDGSITNIPKLFSKMYFDHGALKTKINHFAVEKRLNRTQDRISYLGKLQLNSNPNIPSVNLFQDFFEEIYNQNSVFSNIFYSTNEIAQIVQNTDQKQLSANTLKLFQLMQFALVNNKCIVGFLDKVNFPNTTPIVEQDFDQVSEIFQNQTMPDEVIDYSQIGNENLDMTIKNNILKAIESKQKGIFTTVNLANYPHKFITKALHDLIYQDEIHQPSSINISYNDGTESRPFPIFQIKKRPAGDFDNLNRLEPLDIGMMSNRHQTLDLIIDRYWIRNIDINMTGDNTAQKDEYTYLETKKKFAEILIRDHPVRINFYHTGFIPVLIGFYRAVAEFLIENQDKKPYLEIIPKIYIGNSQKEIPDKDKDFQSLEPWH